VSGEKAVIAGTIFAGTPTPLVSWFAAVCYVVSQKEVRERVGGPAGAEDWELPDRATPRSRTWPTLIHPGSGTSHPKPRSEHLELNPRPRFARLRDRTPLNGPAGFLRGEVG
jgi:hypothetical protein